jgi:hypothetical protein
MKNEIKEEIKLLNFSEKSKLINELSNQLWNSVHEEFSKIQFEQSNNIAHQFVIDNPLGKIFYKVTSSYNSDVMSQVTLGEIRIKSYEHPNNYSEHLVYITIIDQTGEVMGKFEFINENLKYSRMEHNIFKSKDDAEIFIKKSEELRKIRIEKNKKDEIERAKKILEELEDENEIKAA